MRIGFIGTGNMGGMLARAFVRSDMPDVEVVACNRTVSKLDELVAKHPRIRKAEDAVSLAKSCGFIFVCVKPEDVPAVLDQIQAYLTPGQFLVSINSVWPVAALEAATPCKIVKIIPSVTQEALSGVILTIYGSRLSREDRNLFETACRHIGYPVSINEDELRVSSDLTSCGPAFLAFLLRSFAEAAVRQSGIPRERADQLAKHMVFGLGKLLVEENCTFDSIISRVAVPGGITEKGLNVLESAAAGLFDRVLLATKQKQEQHSDQR